MVKPTGSETPLSSMRPLPWPLCPNLGSPAFAPTDVAKLAAAAAPSVMMLGQGPLGLLQAEWVERVTADLAKGHLAPLMRPTKFPEIPVSLERNTEVFRHPLL